MMIHGVEIEMEQRICVRCNERKFMVMKTSSQESCSFLCRMVHPPKKKRGRKKANEHWRHEAPYALNNSRHHTHVDLSPDEILDL